MIRRSSPKPSARRCSTPSSHSARVGIGIAEVERIDRDNILQATFWAMAQALAQIDGVALALVDGNRAPPLSCRVQTIVEGDARSLSIAAASIIAKVTRDRIMVGHDATYPAIWLRPPQGLWHGLPPGGADAPRPHAAAPEKLRARCGILHPLTIPPETDSRPLRKTHDVDSSSQLRIA